ncbi:MAG: transporter substrate-binding domain-containing protein [Desulfobacteraceae bacterium]|nr:transporter substrate-binding domain-containing protein [Desulfobacteraceae bacterium]
MKKTIAGLVVWFVFAGVGFAAEKVIKIASVPWPPYYDQFMPGSGIGAEVITAVFERVGYKAEFNFMAWNRALKEVSRGKYDALANAYYTEDRAKTYLASESYMDSSVMFFKRKESPIVWNNNLKKLMRYKIGIVKGYANSPEFDKANYLNKRVSRTEILNVKKLLLKQADLIVMDLFVGHHINKDKLYGDEKDVIEPLYPPLMVNKLHLMVSKKVPNGPGKLKAFNTGLRQIKKDGTLKKILAKYGVKK